MIICQLFFVLNSLGVMPVTLLKVRKKEVSVEKPDAIHTSEIFFSGSRRMISLAWAMRYSPTNCENEQLR